MKLTHKLAYSGLVLFLMTLLFSCEPDNVDIISTDEMETETEIINCDLVISLAEQPPGSGNLYSVVSGGTEPFAYHWSNGATTAETIVNAPGIYFLDVIDADSCFISDTINIGFNGPCPDILLTITEQPPGSGDLFSSVTGGTPPYEYIWSNGDTGAETSVDSSGLYSLLVIDSDSCGEVQYIEVNLGNFEPCDDFTLSLAEQPPGSGAIYSAVSGGVAPYSYLWSTGETSADIQVNAFGLYTLTVMDSDSCMIVDSIQIN